MRGSENDIGKSFAEKLLVILVKSNSFQAEVEDDRVITDQSAAAMRNRKWDSKISEAWLRDKCIRRAEKDSLDADEEAFWNDVISKYLTPIIQDFLEQERVREGLVLLRNKVHALATF